MPDNHGHVRKELVQALTQSPFLRYLGHSPEQRDRLRVRLVNAGLRDSWAVRLDVGDRPLVQPAKLKRMRAAGEQIAALMGPRPVDDGM